MIFWYLLFYVTGITGETVDPDGGVIDRFESGHAHAGQPNGMIREAPAMELLSRHFILTSERKPALRKLLTSV